MLGPVAGLVDDVVKLAQGIPLNAVEGKPEQTGGDLVKLGKGLIPGANLWYAKAALDHMIFNQLQEYFSWISAQDGAAFEERIQPNILVATAGRNAGIRWDLVFNYFVCDSFCWLLFADRYKYFLSPQRRLSAGLFLLCRE
jgi:hypothetical protein